MTLPDRLENWGNYWRWRTRPEHANSFEGRFRSTRGNEKEYDNGLPVPTCPPDVDPADAEVVEGAVCALDMYHHMILKGWYVRRQSPRTCLFMAMRASGHANRNGPAIFLASLSMAHTLLGDELERPAVTRKHRAREMVRKMLGLPPLTFATDCVQIAEQSGIRLVREPAARWEAAACPDETKPRAA